MKINSIQSNTTQSFGMSLRLRKGAIKEISELIQNSPDPQKMEKKIIQDILNPIHKSSANVLVGDRVFPRPRNVLLLDHTDESLKIVYDSVERVNETVLKFHAGLHGKLASTPEYVEYPNYIESKKAEESIKAESGLLRRLCVARELAKAYDSEAAVSSYNKTISKTIAENPTAAKLNKLFG